MRPWSRRTRRLARRTGCGRSSPRTRPPAGGSTMPPRCWGPTTSACSCATGGHRIAASTDCKTCLNHLLQRCKHGPGGLTVPGPASTLRAGLDAGPLQRGSAERARDGNAHRPARSAGRRQPPLDDAERFAGHLATEFPAVFLFLWDPSLDATNWRAEQAIRPAVVIRKVCGGNRTRHGADTQQVLASVVRTARQRDLDLPPLIAAMLRAAEPVVPELLGLPPPPP